MIRLNKSLILSAVTFALVLAQSCRSDQQKTENSRTNSETASGSEVTGESYDQVTAQLEAFKNDTSLAPGQSSATAALLQQAIAKINAGIVSGKNLYVSAVSVAVRSGSTESCTVIQIQQRSGGKVVVKDTLVPEGQAMPCAIQKKTGLGSAVLASFMKIAGDNYAGGIGVGLVYYDGTYIAGCGAGAVGYASKAANAADGTAGAVCSQVVNVKTGETL